MIAVRDDESSRSSSEQRCVRSLIALIDDLIAVVASENAELAKGFRRRG